MNKEYIDNPNNLLLLRPVHPGGQVKKAELFATHSTGNYRVVLNNIMSSEIDNDNSQFNDEDDTLGQISAQADILMSRAAKKSREKTFKKSEVH